MRTTNTHVYFWRGPFSNWHPASFKDPAASDLVFSNTEQAFMYWKARHFKDYSISQEIARTPNPQEAKKLGRSVEGYNEEEWSQVRVNIMTHVNYFKFIQNQDLYNELMGTGSRILVEASPYDKIWGVGLREEDERILDDKNWQGLNLLGESLMKVRKQLNAIKDLT
jgi:ribA/ribD-fused uncharacterized protein